MATIYKEGCNDREMTRRIQRVVGVADDGVWGPKTTAAVKAWQRAHSLKDDGIVGPATLSRMGLSPATAEGISITRMPIGKHVTRCDGRQVRYIAIHYTAGGNSRPGAAAATRNVFLTRSASADFVVDDEQVVQVNPDIRSYYCWAVGDRLNPYTGGGSLYGKATNRNTVSIEICSTLQKGTSAAEANHDGWSLSDKAVENARRLTRHLMKTYGIPKERVLRHYDVSGKLCPGVPGWNDGPLFSTDGRQTAKKNNSGKWKIFLESL